MGKEVIALPSNGEKKPEKREQHPIEQRPKKDDAATKRALGQKALEGASKDQPKK
jgi:hypothetical protein